MKITRTSILSGKTRTKDINVTIEQLEAWESGALIQVAMPHLTASDREFIMTGIIDEEWDNAFPEEDE